MINNTPNNLSFSGRFIFKGNKQETAGFINFLRQEISISDKPNSLINTVNHNGDKIVLTGKDCKLSNDSTLLGIFPQITANKFYDPANESLFPSIIRFDPIDGLFEKIKKVLYKGIGRYHREVHKNNGELDKFPVARTDFNKKIGICEAFDFFKTINRNLGYETLLSERNTHLIRKSIQQAVVSNKTLENLKVQGIEGVGRDCFVLKTDDSQVVKLSLSPCFPEKFESFDLPAIEKGHVNTDAGTVYFCITPKAKNSDETRINAEHIKYVINDIKENGFLTNDIYNDSSAQVVLYENKPYLCDYDCAQHNNGISRLFVSARDKHLYSHHTY